jgi:hypothetical protein
MVYTEGVRLAAGENAICLWNIRSPYLPLATLDGHEDICSSINWLDTPCKPYHVGEKGNAPNSPGTGEPRRYLLGL